jgi:Fe-S cluster assembly protein SufB
MNAALNNEKFEPLVKKFFSKSISLSDHKFASLHYAVWS